MRRIVAVSGLATIALALSVATVPVAAGATPPGRSPAAGPSTADQASTLARRTGRSVDVPGATTSTDRVTANPDGSMTLTRSLVPTRKFVAGAWHPLDATLHRDADGRISPAMSTNGLRLSGGGTGPLVTMTAPGRSLDLALPVALPAPVLSGATATYANVRPGVDLQVRADVQGGITSVFVVRTAAAAADPTLATLRLSTRATGLTLSTAPDGSIAGTDAAGRPVLTAPPPIMWDSTATTGPTVRALDTGRALDAGTGRPAVSDARTPGLAARRAAVGVRVSAGALTLLPDRGMLSGRGVVFPLYVDPTLNWTPVSPDRSAWASVSHSYPGTFYWNKTPDPQGDLQVGNSNESLLPNGIWSRTFLNFSIPVSTLSGATILDAALGMTEVNSWSCTPSQVNVYAPAATLTSGNASWNSWVGTDLGPVVASQMAAHATKYSGCPAAAIGFDVKSAISGAVAAGKTTQTFVLTGVNEATDYNSWKEFNKDSVNLTVRYNRPPDTPSALSTSPSTSCGAVPPSAVGDAAMTFYASVSDPDANLLGVTFQLWKTGSPDTLVTSSDPNLLTAGSGQVAAWSVPEATLKAASGPAAAGFYWRVQTTDGGLLSPFTGNCPFTFDPTRTGAPTVTRPATPAIGQPATFTVTRAPTGAVPTSYLYQLNGGAPATVAATAGNASITITPTRFTNTLTVIGLTVGGNIGDTASSVFNASPSTTVAASDDLTGDGIADVLAVGNAHNLPSGLWLGGGRNNGQVQTTATDIGAYGNGVTGANSPADFDGASVITGHFTGTGLQDVLAYYPGTGGGVVLNGNGDGSVLQAAQSGNEHTISAGSLTDINGLDPIQVANAGNSSGQSGVSYPDLIAVTGDATYGYYLNYYANQNGLSNYAFPTALTAPTPDLDMAWDQWRIATTQTATGTAMFLWKPATGALYLWRNLAADVNTGALTYTPYTIRASGWNTNAAITLSAADINTDGTPDLWTVGNGQAARANLVTGLTGTPAIAAQAVQTLVTSNHAWNLNDANAGTVGADAARDTVGGLHLTGSGGATWNTGDLYTPDVRLDGVGAALTSTTSVVSTNGNFTVGAWVNPTLTGGTVASQDGTQAAGFRIWAEATDNSWRFGMPTADAASPAWDVASAGPGSVRLGVWTQVTAAYASATGTMSLYVNGVAVAVATHTAAWNATGRFRVGDALAGGTHTGFLAGQVADVQAWNSALTGAQIGAPGVPVVTSAALGLAPDPVAPPAAPAGAVVGAPASVNLGGGVGNTDVGYQYAIGTSATATPTAWIGAAGDGGAVLPVTPVASGSTRNYLIVRAVDRFGNVSASVRYSFLALGGTTHHVAADATGDGRADVTVLADNGTGGSVLWRWDATPGPMTAATAPQGTAVTYPNGGTLAATGDFDGDGRSDVAVFTQSGTDVLLTVQRSDRDQLVASAILQTLTGWSVSRMHVVAGDFNGDGLTDLAATYDQGSQATVTWVLLATSTSGHPSFAAPAMWASACAGCDDINRSKTVAGDFNGDGKADIAEFYDYGNGQTKIWMLYANSTGTAFTCGCMVWDSGLHWWTWSASKFFVGDFTGDGRLDIGAAYADPYAYAVSFWVFAQQPDGTIGWPNAWTGYAVQWNLDFAATEPVAGDFNADGKADVALVVHCCGPQQARLWTMTSTGSSFNAPVSQGAAALGPAGTGAVNPLPGVRYQLVAWHSGKCLEVAGGGTANATPLDQATCVSGQLKQQFTVNPVSGGWAQLLPANAPGKCAEINSASTADGVAVDLYDCLGGAPNEMFALTYAGGWGNQMMVRLQPLHSGKCVGISGGGQADGTPAIQWTCVAGPNDQYFYLRPAQ